MANDLTIYEPRNIAELREFAKEVCSTELVPQNYRDKPADAMVAMMYGKETAGLGPLTSLQYIAVINGRPAFYADATPGIAFNKGIITDMEEFYEGDEYHDDFAAVCIVTRATGSKVTQRFSISDAKKAGLWDQREKVQRRNKRTGETYMAQNDSPWFRFPKRMLQWRARSWAIRDAAPHMLFGPTVDELSDLDRAREQHQGPEHAKDVTPAVASHQPLSAPQLVELYDQWGAEYLVQPGEVEQWIKDAVSDATEEECIALLDNNASNADICASINKEIEAHLSSTNAPPPSAEHAASRPPDGTTAAGPEFDDNGSRRHDGPSGQGTKTAKQRATEIAQAFIDAPSLEALIKTEERVRADMNRLPDAAKTKLASIFHERRKDLMPTGVPELAELHDSADEEWTQETGRVEDERQGELGVR